jgi:hypothetical protein
MPATSQPPSGCAVGLAPSYTQPLKPECPLGNVHRGGAEDVVAVRQLGEELEGFLAQLECDTNRCGPGARIIQAMLFPNRSRITV